mmetsp:Transcript_38492/g.78513  ORF Transcript_38492/g.78513 Transcript_38492/m.78513 type:complete len:81 (-) Transcript_38492:199-441(-)
MKPLSARKFGKGYPGTPAWLRAQKFGHFYSANEEGGQKESSDNIEGVTTDLPAVGLGITSWGEPILIARPKAYQLRQQSP